MVHELTSPYHLEANGHAEQAVGAMKKLLKKTGSRRQLGEALLEYRNTPRVCDGLSPAQWMFGRRQRTRAPAPTQHYRRITDEQLAGHMKARLDNADKVKENGPKLAGHEFQLGDRVVTQNPITKLWYTHGRICRKHSKRRYRIQADEGHSFSRNGKFIKLSATGLTPKPATRQEDNAPPTEVVVTSRKPATKPAPARREGSKRNKKKPKRYLD